MERVRYSGVGPTEALMEAFVGTSDADDSRPQDLPHTYANPLTNTQLSALPSDIQIVSQKNQ